MSRKRTRLTEEIPAVSSTNQNGVAPAPTTPSSKKRKMEDSDDALAVLQPSISQKTYTKHEKHWNADGNLLLQFGDIRFKVHKSRLAAESTFFSALFDLKDGKQPEYDDMDTLNRCLNGTETVDGLDLFNFDRDDEGSDIRGAKSFAALLSAMDGGIKFVYHPPTLDEVLLIHSAAILYRFDLFREYCEKYIHNVFPDNRPSRAYLPPDVSIDTAIKGVIVGTENESLSSILRPAFYNLARASILHDDPADADTAKAARSALRRLPPNHLVTLLALQKHLAYAWEYTLCLVDDPCTTNGCECHRKMVVPKTIKTQWTFDPIAGIRQLLDQSQLFKGCCHGTVKTLKQNLVAQREKIWEDIKTWIMDVDNSDDEDSSDDEYNDKDEGRNKEKDADEDESDSDSSGSESDDD